MVDYGTHVNEAWASLCMSFEAGAGPKMTPLHIATHMLTVLLLNYISSSLAAIVYKGDVTHFCHF